MVFGNVELMACEIVDGNVNCRFDRGGTRERMSGKSCALLGVRCESASSKGPGCQAVPEPQVRSAFLFQRHESQDHQTMYPSKFRRFQSATIDRGPGISQYLGYP